MPESWFAVPGKRALPMPDENHTRLAWDAVDRTHGLSEQERETARKRILERAKELGVDTSKWSDLSAMSFEIDSLEAMALNLPDVIDHPNRMPFSGVLTRLDQPSDRPVHGSLGKLVVIPSAVAEAALPSLLGMAVDFVPDLDGHDPKNKIGIITAAYIEGNELRVEGFLYAADFPEETALIKARKDVLGFSYETAQNFVESLETEHLVLAACTFTGAAILRKDKAAYQTTSLAASAAGETDMTNEEINALIAAAVEKATAPLNQQVTDLSTKLAASEETRMKVEPHAKALDACADTMEAAAVGGHPSNGHVAVLRRMAGAMRAEAAMGKIPHIYRDHDYAGGSMYAGADNGNKDAGSAEIKALKDQVASLTTKLDDKLAATRAAAPEPQRKTLTPEISRLLARAGIDEPGEDGKLSAAGVDKALKDSGLGISERLRIKAALGQAGVLPAN